MGDDTATNDMDMKCIDGEFLEGFGDPWGSWGGWQTCPEGMTHLYIRTGPYS